MSISADLFPRERLSTENIIVRAWLVWMYLLSMLTAGGAVNICELANCLHNSPCQISHDLGAFAVRCLCPPGWVGAHCQAKFHVTMTTVTMTTVTLTTSQEEVYPINKNGWLDNDVYLAVSKLFQVDSNSERSDGSIVKSNAKPSLTTSPKMQVNRNVQYDPTTYSIQFWSRNQSHWCNILPPTSASTITISGLTKDTDYVFCAKTSQTEECNLDLVTEYSRRSYCVNVRTTSTDLPSNTIPKIAIIILASASGLGLMFLIAILIYAINKNYLFPSRHSQQTSTYISNRAPQTCSDDSYMESLLSNTAVNQKPDKLTNQIHHFKGTNQKVTIHKPNQPGKPEHHLVQKRMRGFAAFAARNEQTIALNTVIEYDTPEEDCEVFNVDLKTVNESTGTFTGNRGKNNLL